MIRPAYIDYLLDHLDPDERAEMECRIASDPEEAAEFERLRAMLAFLETDREESDPPAGLTDRAISRLSGLLAAEGTPTSGHVGTQSLDEVHVDLETPATALPAEVPEPPRRRPLTTDRPESRFVGGRFRGDLVVACGIGLIAVGLVLSFVNRARYASDILACKQNLMTLHQGLTGYADTHGDRFPEVGTPAFPTAGSFASVLTEAGQCPPGFHPGCPASAVSTRHISATPATYTYSLGHRSPNGTVEGLRRSREASEENDLLPISSDLPVASAAVVQGATSPHSWGHNILYVAGNVRFATTATVGVNGDDIYRNQLGQVAAGVDRLDSVLGAAFARP